MIATVVLVIPAPIAGVASAQAMGKHGGEMMSQAMHGRSHQAGTGCRAAVGDSHGAAAGFFLALRAELQLTAEQVERLRGLEIETATQLIRNQGDLGVAEIELDDLLSQANVDVNAVDAKIAAIGRLQTASYGLRVHAELNARAVLTPEQLKTYEEMTVSGMHGTRSHGRRSQ